VIRYFCRTTVPTRSSARSETESRDDGRSIPQVYARLLQPQATTRRMQGYGHYAGACGGVFCPWEP